MARARKPHDLGSSSILRKADWLSEGSESVDDAKNSRTAWVVLNLWPADQACDTNLFGEILWVLRGQGLERTVASHVNGDEHGRFEFSRRLKMVGGYYQGSLIQGAMPYVDADNGEVVKSESL